MFTGIVTATGQVARTARIPEGLELEIRAPYRGLTVGESIAVDGACLTVASRRPGGFSVQVVSTTLDRTLLGSLAVGRRVNLERAVRAGDRLGGHWVQGHVDGIGKVRRVMVGKGATLVDIVVPAAVARVSIPLGSITVQGVSLTVNRRGPGNLVQVSLVPHTLAVTTLGSLAAGDPVHVEGDALGKYLLALVEGRGRGKARRTRR